MSVTVLISCHRLVNFLKHRNLVNFLPDRLDGIGRHNLVDCWYGFKLSTIGTRLSTSMYCNSRL